MLNSFGTYHTDLASFYGWSGGNFQFPDIRKLEGKFAGKCGLLDYYKPSEYNNLIQFVHALEQYEKGPQDDRATTENVQSKEANSARPNLDIVDDFIAWFWDNNVLDLKESWQDTELDQASLMTRMRLSKEWGVRRLPRTECVCCFLVSS